MNPVLAAQSGETILLLAVLYFLPSVIALKRRHANSKAIFALNLLGGWTVVGWIAAMVWAFTANTRVPSTR